ncbi:MAG TPA: undecaprenyl-phosphate glucose phosphotransferase [Bacteroidota bacterium]
MSTLDPQSSSSQSHGADLLIPFLTVLFDAIAIESSFFISYWIRFQSTTFESFGFVRGDAPPLSGYMEGSIFVVVVWLLLFNARKMYRTRRSVNLSDEAVAIVKVVSLGMLIVMSAAFFYREFSYSRVVFGFLWIFSILFLMTGRGIVQWIERRLYRKGKHLKRAVIIGSAEKTSTNVFQKLHHHRSFGFQILGHFADHPLTANPVQSEFRCLGSLEESPEYIKNKKVETVFIAVAETEHHRLFEIIGECEGINVEFLMVPDMLELLTNQVRVEELEGIPFLKLKSIPLTLWGRVTKRTFDIFIAAASLLLLSPLWISLMALIKLTSRGPVIFKQKRIGLDEREFTMYKFRSMRLGSEQFDDRAGLGISKDPRRTFLGSILRKTSLDELPQLFNVLRGDMSLVGPRPERTRYVEEFRTKVPKYLDRHRMKTGVTGWAQVNGLRGDTSLDERIKYDLYYIENWSLAFDIKILLRTIRASFATKGVD